MEVNCIPGSNGGLPQHFVLEVRGALENSSLLQASLPQSDQGSGEAVFLASAPAVYQDRSDEPSFQLYGLQPGYDYTIAVYAENSRGRSQPVLIENVRVAESGQPRRLAETRLLGDLGAVLPRPADFEGTFVVVGLIGELSGMKLGPEPFYWVPLARGVTSLCVGSIFG